MRGLSLLMAAGTSVACNNSAASTGYTPITGIQILSSSIVAGHGCGVLPNQVFKYVAVVSPITIDGGIADPVASSVFDCFADGFFSNLLVPDGSIPTFQIAVFAYNAQSFPSALQCPPTPPNAAPCPGDDAGAALEFQGAANWTTTCTAAQVAGATSPASCQALVPTDAGLGDGGDGDATSPPGQDGAASDAAESGETGSSTVEAATSTDAPND